MLKAGAKILVPHPSEGFVGATVESAGAEIKCQADDGERLTVDAKKVAESDEKAFEGVADLTSLDVLNEATVVHTLRLRHKQQQVYSAVGDVCDRRAPPLHTPRCCRALSTHDGAPSRRAPRRRGTRGIRA